MALDATGWHAPAPKQIRTMIEDEIGLSQADVARRLGLNRAVVSIWLLNTTPREIKFTQWIALEVLAGRYTRRRGA